MKIVFTKSGKIGSKLIRWGLSEPVSHVAFVFDEKLVIHSSMSGVELQWLNTFKKHNDCVHSIEYKMQLEQEEEVYQSILNSYDDCGYDYGAYFYFAWCILKNKLFGSPLPINNAWGSNNKFLCTEMARTLPLWMVELNKDDYSLVSPYKLYIELMNNHGSTAEEIGEVKSWR